MPLFSLEHPPPNMSVHVPVNMLRCICCSWIGANRSILLWAKRVPVRFRRPLRSKEWASVPSVHALPIAAWRTRASTRSVHASRSVKKSGGKQPNICGARSEDWNGIANRIIVILLVLATTPRPQRCAASARSEDSRRAVREIQEILRRSGFILGLVLPSSKRQCWPTHVG